MALAKAEKCYYDESLLFQSLEGHVTDCLKILKTFIDSNDKMLENFSNKWNLNYTHLIKNLFLTTYLHDVGKLTEEFQRNINCGKHSQFYPHAFFSTPIIFYLYTQKRLEPVFSDEKIHLQLCCILGHHTQLFNSIYDDVRTTPRFIQNEIIEVLNKMPEIHQRLGFEDLFPLDWTPLESLDNMYLIDNEPLFNKIIKCRNSLKIESREIRDKNRVKAIYSIFHSLLKLSDDYASYSFHEFAKKYRGTQRTFGDVLEDANNFVLGLPVLSLDDILKGNAPYGFQEKLHRESPKFCSLFAPCGRGKTEAALLWATNICRETGRNKIIFAMPTQITSNSMRDRLCDLFGEDNVGLFHGKSFVKLKGDKREEKDADEELEADELEEVRDDNFKGNIFFKPVTVTTIDHVIYSFVHGFSQADFALGNLQNAVVIFDEVHYYEEQTLRYLLNLFKIMSEMDIPYFLMSGTLPQFFVESVKKINSALAGPIIDMEGINFEPFKIKVYSEPLLDMDGFNEKVVNEICNNYRKRLSQFIILNTVRRSQRFYERLRKTFDSSENPNIILHNSQFTYRDRTEKEREIHNKASTRPFILVATQVIEISLDISCDVMYTELAPPDALAQRGGRLNRKGRHWHSDGIEYVMNVFLPEEFFKDTSVKDTPYSFSLLEATKARLSDGPYSYSKFKDLCDAIYQNYKLLPEKNLSIVFNECCLFGYSPLDVTYGSEDDPKLLQIREEKMQTIEAVPFIYYNNDETNLTVENQVKIPLWWYKEDLKKQGNAVCFQLVAKKAGRKMKHYLVCNVPYSKETGFDYDRNKEYEFFGGNII